MPRYIYIPIYHKNSTLFQTTIPPHFFSLHDRNLPCHYASPIFPIHRQNNENNEERESVKLGKEKDVVEGFGWGFGKEGCLLTKNKIARMTAREVRDLEARIELGK
jgi:hypothetical protein